jgi:surfactin synthase thioesterase subunit
MWDFCREKFPQGEFLSLPGHGDKIATACPETMEEIAALLFREMDTTAPFQIIGHSMGGYLIPSLISAGARPVQIGLFHSKIGADDNEKKIQRQRAIDLVKDNKALYIRTMITHLFSDRFKVKKYHEIDRLIEEANHIDVSNIIACQKAMKNRPCGISTLFESKIPIHYFAGEKDNSVTLDQIMEERSQLNQFSSIRVEEKIGHMGQWECPHSAIDWLNQIAESH